MFTVNIKNTLIVNVCGSPLTKDVYRPVLQIFIIYSNKH